MPVEVHFRRSHSHSAPTPVGRSHAYRPLRPPRRRPVGRPAGPSRGRAGRRRRRAVYARHHRLRAVDHLRHGAGALHGLRQLRPGYAEPGHHPRAHHGARRRSQRRPLLRDGDGRDVSRRRPRQHGRHRAAPARGPRQTTGQRGDVAQRPQQLARRRRLAVESGVDLVRLRRRDHPEARRQEDLPEPHEDRRHRALGGRPVHHALRDGHEGQRHAGRVDHLRRRQPVELRVARRRAPAPDGRCEPGRRVQGGPRPRRREGPHRLPLRPVRRVEGRQLRPVADGPRRTWTATSER